MQATFFFFFFTNYWCNFIFLNGAFLPQSRIFHCNTDSHFRNGENRSAWMEKTITISQQTWQTFFEFWIEQTMDPKNDHVRALYFTEFKLESNFNPRVLTNPKTSSMDLQCVIKNDCWHSSIFVDWKSDR